MPEAQGSRGQAGFPRPVNPESIFGCQTATREEVFDRRTRKPHRQTDETNSITKTGQESQHRFGFILNSKRIFEAKNGGSVHESPSSYTGGDQGFTDDWIKAWKTLDFGI